MLPRKFVGGGFKGPGFGNAILDEEGILAVAQYSPQLALAKAMRMPFSPFLLNISNTWADNTALIGNPQSFQSNGPPGTNTTTIGGEPTIIDGVTFTIDAPNAFAGNVQKTLSDFFFRFQSGIQATMSVLGAPRFQIAPFFTPISNLCDELNESWMKGFVLSHDQTISMTFQATIPFPTPPVTATCTFRMWQPIDTAGVLVQMSTVDAYNRLAAMGYDTSSQDQPVNR
jgi:hypothetical protein